jgi:hypothetical protein
MIFDTFQNARAKINPPIGLLNDKNAPNAIDTVIVSISRYEISILLNKNW